MSTTRPSCKRRWRAWASRSTTSSLTRSARRTSAGSRAPRSWTASGWAWGREARRRPPSRRRPAKRSWLWHPDSVTRQKNSDKRLDERLDEDAEKAERRGIFELFERDEDAPLTREAPEDDAE